MQVTGRSRLFAREARPTGPAPAPKSPRSRLASTPHGQGRRRHRCGHDRGARPRRRRGGPGGRRRLPGADPALPPARLGRARCGRDLGRRAGHPGRGRGAPGRAPATPWPPSASPTSARRCVAFDRSTGRPLHRAIVWQDRRTAALCAELTEAGHLPLVRATTGPRARPLLQRHQGGLAAPPRRPRRSPPTTRTSPSARSTAGCCGTSPAGARGRHLRHRPVQRQPHPPARYGHALLVPRALRPLRRAPAHPPRGAAVGRPLRHRGARRPRPGAGGPRRRPRLGRARRPAGRALRAGLLRARHGQGHLRHRQLRAGQRRPRAPARARRAHGQLRLGPRRARRRRTRRVAYALEGSAFVSGAAIQWLRDGLGIIAAAAEVGPLAASVPDSGGVTFVPALDRPRQPVVGSAGARHRHRPHPRRRPRPAGAGLRRGAWRSRCAT